jgi:hypothetical protein
MAQKMGRRLGDSESELMSSVTRQVYSRGFAQSDASIGRVIRCNYIKERRDEGRIAHQFPPFSSRCLGEQIGWHA